jgi:hypothetical protein
MSAVTYPVSAVQPGGGSSSTCTTFKLSRAVNSSAALMATSTRPFVSALEQNENGWEVAENGDLRP